MRLRLYSLFVFAALLFMAGCERSDVSPFTVEGDEPGYRRGKDLIKQGRNQEALSEFQKVIDKRGLNNSPESHLEVGLLFQYHIKDPISAIYHYKKFRELKPNSQQADLVRQRIDAATRDFARTLLAPSLEKQLDQLDTDDISKRLQRENDKLKAELAAVRANRPVSPAPAEEETPVALEPGAPVAAPTRPASATNDNSPLVSAVVDTEPAPFVQPRPPVAQAVRPPVSSTPTTTRPPAATSTTRPATTPATTTRPGSYRRHVIGKGDTLYSLAQKYYGNRSRWRDIYAANRDVMKNEGDLRIGMEVKIPQ